MTGKEDADIMFMSRCIELAALGKGNTYPNPMVGSVIVYKGLIIGEGYHREYSRAHAEVHAISSVQNSDLLPNSTLYVSLEPCCHKGETPPCTNLIIDSGISEVVIGSMDPNPVVKGKGIEQLQEAGCRIKTGVLEDKVRRLNRAFFTYHEKGRPYIILKWAESKDGYIDQPRCLDAPTGPNWITPVLARTLVHKWRTEEQAIMVGSKTAKVDNPSLTARYWAGRQPVRITLSRTADLARDLSLMDQENQTIIYSGLDLEPDGKNVFVCIDYKKDILEQILHDLYERGIQSLIIEGGAELINSFIRSGLWDEALVFRGKQLFSNGIPSPQIDFPPDEQFVFNHWDLKIFRKK